MNCSPAVCQSKQPPLQRRYPLCIRTYTRAHVPGCGQLSPPGHPARASTECNSSGLAVDVADLPKAIQPAAQPKALDEDPTSTSSSLDATLPQPSDAGPAADVPAIIFPRLRQLFTTIQCPSQYRGVSIRKLPDGSLVYSFSAPAAEAALWQSGACVGTCQVQPGTLCRLRPACMCTACMDSILPSFHATNVFIHNLLCRGLW